MNEEPAPLSSNMLWKTTYETRTKTQFKVVIISIVCFMLSLYFLFHPLSLGLGSNSCISSRGYCTQSISTPIVDTTISNLQIQADFPAQMKVKQSYLIEVSLIPITSQGYRSTITVETSIASTSNLTPAGTPGVPLLNSFGTGYMPFAIATLNASTFVKEPNEPQESALGQSIISWDWNVTPQSAGPQVVNVNIKIQWKSMKGGQVIPQTYTVSNPQFDVEVEDPFLEQGKLDFGSLVSQVIIASFVGIVSFITGGASLVAIGKRVWERYEKRRNKKSTKGIKNSANSSKGNKKPKHS